MIKEECHYKFLSAPELVLCLTSKLRNVSCLPSKNEILFVKNGKIRREQ